MAIVGMRGNYYTRDGDYLKGRVYTSDYGRYFSGVGSLFEVDTQRLQDKNWAGNPLWGARHARGEYEPLCSVEMSAHQLKAAGWARVYARDVPKVWRSFLSKEALCPS